MNEKKTGFWSVGRLVIGIVLMILAIIVIFQSCAAGVVNTLESSDDVGGSAGVFVSILMIASGIISICTRNAVSKIGPFVTAGLLVLAGILGLCNAAVYEDLVIWGIVCLAAAVVFIICGIKTQKPENE